MVSPGRLTLQPMVISRSVWSLFEETGPNFTSKHFHYPHVTLNTKENFMFWPKTESSHKYSDNCTCAKCTQHWNNALFSATDKSIKEANRKTPGQQCPFCGTNPSKRAHGSSWKDSCGHEVRKDGLVVRWEKNGKRVRCVCPEKTRQSRRIPL